MKIAELNKQVTLLSCTRVKSDAGQPKATYTSEGMAWAKVEFSGNEAQQVTGINATNRLRVTLHRNQNITRDWRIVYNNLQYNIVSAEPDSDKGLFTIIEANATSDKYTG